MSRARVGFREMLHALCGTDEDGFDGVTVYSPARYVKYGDAVSLSRVAMFSSVSTNYINLTIRNQNMPR